MKTQTTTNLLLCVIAICLLLITGRLYNVSGASSAYALEGEILTPGKEPTPVPVALYGQYGHRWLPIQVNTANYLLVESH